MVWKFKLTIYCVLIITARCGKTIIPIDCVQIGTCNYLWLQMNVLWSTLLKLRYIAYMECADKKPMNMKVYTGFILVWSINLLILYKNPLCLSKLNSHRPTQLQTNVWTLNCKTTCLSVYEYYYVPFHQIK